MHGCFHGGLYLSLQTYGIPTKKRCAACALQAFTLAGEAVWRRRKYRVRRGDTPGTFYFSVLDNGACVQCISGE